MLTVREYKPELLVACPTYTPYDVVDSVLDRILTKGEFGLGAPAGQIACVYAAGRQVEEWCVARNVPCVPWTAKVRRKDAVSWIGDLEEDIFPRISGAVTFDCRLDKEALLVTALLRTIPVAPPILRVVSGAGCYWEELLTPGDVGIGLRAGLTGATATR